MALPNAPATAYDGYTYTEYICQEYGQHPRRYQVRDPIPDSDWRNDGGWAIVLERGSHFRQAEYQFNIPNHIDDRTIVGHASAATVLGHLATGWATNQQVVGADDNGVWESPQFWNIRSGTLITAQDGTQGFVTTQYWGRAVIIDRNNNGELDAGDMALGSALGRTGVGNNLYYAERRTVVRLVEPETTAPNTSAGPTSRGAGRGRGSRCRAGWQRNCRRSGKGAAAFLIGRSDFASFRPVHRHSVLYTVIPTQAGILWLMVSLP